MHAGRWGVVSRPAAPPRGVVVVLVHVAPRAVISGTVERPDDDQAGWPEQPLGCAGRLDRGRVRRRLSARSHTWIARVAADPPRAVLGGRELLRRRRLLSGVCVCTAATFSVRSRAPRSTRSPACAGWRSRECVESANLALTRHLNARHVPRETINRAWAGAALGPTRVSSSALSVMARSAHLAAASRAERVVPHIRFIFPPPKLAVALGPEASSTLRKFGEFENKSYSNPLFFNWP